MPAGGAQPPGALGDPERVALKTLKRPLGKDHVGPRDRGYGVELDPDAAALLALMQGDDPAAEHVMLAHRRAQLAQQPRHRPRRGRDALQPQRRGAHRIIPAPRKHQRQRRLLADGQQQGTLDTLHDPAVAHLHIDIAHRPEGDRASHPLPGDDLSQTDRPEPHMPRGKAHQLSVTQHRVQRQLQVRVLGQRKLSPRGRQALGIGPQMLPQPHRHLGLTLLGHQRHHPHELDERRPKRPSIRKLAHDHDQTVGDQRPDLNSSRQPVDLSD